VPHISLVSREMWDSANLNPALSKDSLRIGLCKTQQGKLSGIPHLAKNERDVGHPRFASGTEIPFAVAVGINSILLAQYLFRVIRPDDENYYCGNGGGTAARPLSP